MSVLDKPHPADVDEMDRQIFDLVNKVRSDPKSLVKSLEEQINRFDGFLMKQPGKTTLRTKEGVAAVKAAIEFLNQAKPVREIKWHTDLYAAAKQHV